MIFEELYYLLDKQKTYTKFEAAHDILRMSEFGLRPVETSYRELANRWGWEQTKVMRFLQGLKPKILKEITTTRKGCSIEVATPNATPNATPKPLYTEGFQEVNATPNATPNATQKKKLIKETSPIPPKENYQEKINIINHTHEEANDPISSFNDWLAENCSYIHSNITLLSTKEYDKLLSAYSEEQIKETCLQIENRKDLRKRYKSLYRTLLNWLKTNFGIKPQLPLQERKRLFQESLRPFLEEFGRDTLNRFYAHWSQTETGDKENPRMKFEMEKFFELGNQLFLWRQRNLT